MEKLYGVQKRYQMPEGVRDQIVKNIVEGVKNEEIKQFEVKDDNVYGIKSRYPEDQLDDTHSCVWGSYFSDHFGWGYKCCHSTLRYSTCLGQEGIKL